MSIISQLSPEQGQILRSLIGTESALTLELARDNLRMGFESHSIRHRIRQCVEKLTAPSTDMVCEAVASLFNHHGVEVVHAAVEENQTEKYYDIKMDYSVYRDDHEVDYSILEAVGLIRMVQTDFFDVAGWSLIVIYYHLTDLGFHFAQACGLVRPDAPLPR